MNRRVHSLVAAAATLSLASLASGADGNAANGEKLAYACLGCHGIENYKNAYPKYAVPKLGGQHEAYIRAALKEYQDGARWHPTMRGYAASLSDQERADLAAYFSAAAPKPAGAAPAGTPPEETGACVACHGRNGIGTIDEYPSIAGQHADYLARALNDYRLGKRKNAIMQPFAQQLTAADIAALAIWYSKQPGLRTPTTD